jgi:hypothetical protein
MLLGLRGMFLALGMVILAMSVGSGAMRLRCVFVLLSRLVVILFHGVFSLLAEECRLRTLSASIVTAPSVHGVFAVSAETGLSKGPSDRGFGWRGRVCEAGAAAICWVCGRRSRTNPRCPPTSKMPALMIGRLRAAPRCGCTFAKAAREKPRSILSLQPCQCNADRLERSVFVLLDAKVI